MTNADGRRARIFLLRHAHAGWAFPCQRDFDRSLDARGRAEADSIGAIMAVNGFLPALALCSDAARCVETLQIVESHLDRPISARHCGELYSGGRGDYLGLIADADGASPLLVVGHNPTMEETANALVRRGGRGGVAGFPTGGLAVIDVPGSLKDAGGGSGALVSFFSPRDC